MNAVFAHGVLRVCKRLTSCLASLGVLAPMLLASPVSALERLRADLPLLRSQITLELGQAETAQDLLEANPYLLELDRAGNGAVIKVLSQVLTEPLPRQTAGVFQESAGHPLLEQILLAASALVKVEGVHTEISGRNLSEALNASYRDGQPHLLGMLRRLPGTTASIDLQALLFYAKRQARQQQDAVQLVKQLPAALPFSSASQSMELGLGWRRVVQSLPASHRSQPLQVVVLQPKSGANGRVVVISHGLWDEPTSFEGWGQWLAGRGYTVLMPVHQGSDANQQQALLGGKQAPPSAAELRLRPLDVSLLLDAVEAGTLLPGNSLKTREVAMVGHSWGATTTLQLAGLATTSAQLRTRCQNPRDPDRNLSWMLQCSWLEASERSSLADPRIKAAVAVSPPLSLLFDSRSGSKLTAKVLLVSGTRDWVVPPGPEAIAPLRQGTPMANGHRLVLADGGGHFNLRAPADQLGVPVLAPLIEAWINQQLKLPSTHRFDSGHWGNADLSLVDVTPRL